jgi:hypothetical protein
LSRRARTSLGQGPTLTPVARRPFNDLDQPELSHQTWSSDEEAIDR